MKNFLQDGENIDAIAPYALTAGQPALVGAALFGVAASDAAISTAVVLKRRGVFNSVGKATGAAWTKGDALYWDNSAKVFTKTASGNKLVAIAYADAASGDATGTVLLTGQVPV